MQEILPLMLPYFDMGFYVFSGNLDDFLRHFTYLEVKVVNKF